MSKFFRMLIQVTMNFSNFFSSNHVNLTVLLSNRGSIMQELMIHMENSLWYIHIVHQIQLL